MQPLVSVCIITYQHADYIRQCLESVCTQQTSFPFEVLVSDHSSTDGTWEICQQLQNEYPHLLHLRQHPREDITIVDGCPTGGANLLACLSWAQAPYIALCEGDDYWCDIHKLELCIQALQTHPQVAGVFHTCNRLNGEKVLTKPQEAHPQHRVLSRSEFIQEDRLITNSSLLLRNLGTWTWLSPWFSETYRIDDALALYAMSHNPHILQLYRPMTTYRVHAQGSWSSLSLMAQALQDERFFMQAIDHWGQDPFFRQACHRRIGLARLLCTCFSIRQGNWLTAMRYWKQASNLLPHPFSGFQAILKETIKRLLCLSR